MNKATRRGLLLLAALLLAGALGFYAQYRLDNKYAAALRGRPGYNVLDGDTDRPAFLVDGWEFYPGQLLTPEDFRSGLTPEEYVYIGQYPTFAAHLGDPYGTATYRLVLDDPGPPEELALYLQELFCAGRVYIGGELVGQEGSLSPYEPRVRDQVYAFRAEGETEIVIQCANYTHYYSGLYYPPAVGSPGAVSRMIMIRMIIYGMLCFGPLAVALSSLALWLRERRKQGRLLGCACLAFAARMSYPFLRGLGAPLIRPLYALEDFCAAAVLLCALLMAGELSGAAVRRYHRRLFLPAAWAMCAATVVFPLFILPSAPLIFNIYGHVLFFWKILAGMYLLFLAVRGLVRQERLVGCLPAAGFYGMSLIVSMLTAGRLEPIAGAWPEEYGTMALVAGFVAVLAEKGAAVAQENRRLTLRLQAEVDRKTQALETLLGERRELLADLLHDVKNPLTAVRSYADLVRSSGVALDSETSAYLDALAERVGAVEARFDQIQDFSRGERGLKGMQRLELNGFLRRFHQTNEPDMELSGLSFRLKLPDLPLYVQADQDRLWTAMENLCYNALSFTPSDGTVTLSLDRDGDWAVIAVADTGAGIPPEDLPHVFDRGFTHRPDGDGEGLGLYIVRSVALEHRGMVTASSEPGRGSVFTLRLPLREM